MNISTAIKKSYSIVWRNLILTQPPILFLLIMSILLGGFNRLGANIYVLIIFITSLLFLTISFFAGWFQMTKKTIAFELDESTNNEEKALKSFGLVKHFFPGVGDYFLSITGVGMLFIILTGLFSYISLKFGIKFLGALDIEFLKKSLEITTANDMNIYFSSLSEEKLMSILKWFSYLFAVQTLGQLIVMWWIPALYYKTKNPITALFLNFKYLFKHPLKSITILMYLIILNIIISLISSFFTQNSILSLISFLLFFYYITYYVVLIFLYYGQNGESTAKDYINSGNDSDGEKLASSESSPED